MERLKGRRVGQQRAVNQTVIAAACGEEDEMGNHGVGYQVPLQNTSSVNLLICLESGGSKVEHFS